jgi:proteic killer suppression protein
LDIHNVVISKRAEKQLKKLPVYIVVKLSAWVNAVEHDGLTIVRKVPGFHDEPLSGKRKGQRSIRLSKSYRAFYIIDESGVTHIAEIVEVNKHVY